MPRSLGRLSGRVVLSRAYFEDSRSAHLSNHTLGGAFLQQGMLPFKIPSSASVTSWGSWQRGGSDTCQGYLAAVRKQQGPHVWSLVGSGWVRWDCGPQSQSAASLLSVRAGALLGQEACCVPGPVPGTAETQL